jgi:hypothetical protein
VTDMETAAERICDILDTLSRPDQFAVVQRLVTITALRSEDAEDYLLFLPDAVAEDIKVHLQSKT